MLLKGCREAVRVGFRVKGWGLRVWSLVVFKFGARGAKSLPDFRRHTRITRNPGGARRESRLKLRHDGTELVEGFGLRVFGLRGA